MGAQGWLAYLAIFTDAGYRGALFATLGVSLATTAATLAISGICGVFLQRRQFPGKSVLVALMTLPLAFPGVVVGFMVIMLAGRQGLIGDISQLLGGPRIVFAYSLLGLFMGYVYFSIPRTILTVMAATDISRWEKKLLMVEMLLSTKIFRSFYLTKRLILTQHCLWMSL